MQSDKDGIITRIKNRRADLGMSYQDLADKTGLSKSTLQRYETGEIDNIPLSKIGALAKGLEVDPKYILGWEAAEGVAPYTPKHKIPILGKISAGIPLFAEENIEGYTTTDLNGGAEYFALRVNGDSMTAARMHHGDVLIVRKQPNVENGEIAVVIVNGDCATVKRYRKEGHVVVLTPQSYNPEHQPQIYNLKEVEIRVLGKVVRVHVEV